MNKKLWLIKAPQFAIIGFLIFNILAMLTYPGGTLHDSSTVGYSFFNNFLSDLGRFISWDGSHNFYSQNKNLNNHNLIVLYYLNYL